MESCLLPAPRTEPRQSWGQHHGQRRPGHPPPPNPRAHSQHHGQKCLPGPHRWQHQGQSLGAGVGRQSRASVRPPCLSSPRQPGQQRSDKATCQSHKIKCFLVFKIAFTQKQLCEPSSRWTDPASTVQRRGGCRRQVACVRADTGDSQGGLLSPAVPPTLGSHAPPSHRRGEVWECPAPLCPPIPLSDSALGRV